MKQNHSKLYSLIPIILIFLLSILYYLQYYDWLNFELNSSNHTPMSLVQGVLIIIIGLIFLSSILFSIINQYKKITAFLIFILSSYGTYVSIRHLWVQNQIKNSNSYCVNELAEAIENSPNISFLTNLMDLDQECTLISWSFLGFSIPMWNLVFFIITVFYTVFWFKNINKT